MGRLYLPVLVLVLSMINVAEAAAVLLFPDCADGSTAPESPVCKDGGVLINPASANPNSVSLGAPSNEVTVGWRFIASPVANNFAVSIFSTASTAASVLPVATCLGITFGDLTGSTGTVWFVVNMFQPSNGGTTETQPILGIFGDGSAPCPLLFTLPSGIVGGPFYVYTNFDDGQYPNIQTRIQMTTSTFPCTAPSTTPVSYVLLGTMQVTSADFAIAAAGFTTGKTGCNADFIYAIK